MTSAGRDAPTAAARDAREASRRSDLAWLALAAVLLRLPAVLAPRHLSFDDGVYGATTLALRDGARPYVDVFSSQGPLHQPLLQLADLVGLRTLNAPRLLPLAAGVAITLCTYVLATRLAGRRAGLVAAGLATTAGSLLVITTGVSGDGPAIAFAVGALAVGFAYRDAPTTGKAVAIGLLVGAALSVKLLVAPAVLAVALLLLHHRRGRDILVSGGVALAVPLLLAAPRGLTRVWDQSVAYHQEPRRFSVPEAAWRIVETLVQRDPAVVATVVVVLAAAGIAGCRPVPLRAAWSGMRPGLVLGVWLAAQVIVLLVEAAMWRPHVSHLVVPLCLLASLRLPPWRPLVIAWVVAVPIALVGVHEIAWPGGYRGDDARVANRLQALPGGAVVVTDDPGFAWRAGLRVPNAFVDASVKQFDQDRITRADVLREAGRPNACAVLVTSRERLGRFPDLAARLEDTGYRRVFDLPDRTLYLRPCR